MTTTTAEIEVKDNTKTSEIICEKLGITEEITFDFNEDEEFKELLESCGKRDQKSVIAAIQKKINQWIEIHSKIGIYFSTQQLNAQHEIETNKIIKSLKKGKKALKSSEDDEGEETEADASTKAPSAVKKPVKCHEFVKPLIKHLGIEVRDDLEYSQTELRNYMNNFVAQEREKNPEKINVKPKDGGVLNKKYFNLYGKLKDLIKDSIEQIKLDIKIVEDSIDEKKATNSEEGSSTFKEIAMMEMWVEKYKGLTVIPETLQFTDFMKYSPYCIEDRNPLEKAKKKVKVSEK